MLDMLVKTTLLLLFCSSAFATDIAVPGEWIAKRSNEHFSWKDIAGKLSANFKLKKIIGPNGEYALFRNIKAKNTGFPKLRGLSFSQPNFFYRSSDDQDPDFEKSWGLHNSGQAVEILSQGIAGKDVGALKAWDIHTGTSELTVAIIDSGLDTEHEDLKTNIWVNTGEIENNGMDDDGNGWIDDRYGWNFFDDNLDIRDDNYHGTFCAGIIGAEAGNGIGSRGINWQVRLMGIKFLDSNGVGTTAGAIDSIKYAVQNGAHIINASWGGAAYDQVLYDTVKWATESGILFVAAAGNNGKNNDTSKDPIYPGSFLLPGILSVAAYNNRDEIAMFSNYGKKTVHIGAPGMAIFSTEPGGYRFGEGTSFAAPFVAGAAALVKSFLPELDVLDLKERLMMTSEVISYYEKERLQSGGRVELYNALRNIRPPRPEPPETWISYAQDLATPHPYENDTVKRFEITHPGATHIRVHFKGFVTEACCDRVVIRDENEKFVATYAGDLGDFWSADALGDTLYIDFQSDYSISEYGFDIDAYQMSLETTLWSSLHREFELPLDSPLMRESFFQSLSFFKKGFVW